MSSDLTLRMVLEAEVAQAEEALGRARQRLGELAPAAGTAAEASRRLEMATAAAALALGRAQAELRTFNEAARAGGGADPGRALELTANVERARVALAAARSEAAAFSRGLRETDAAATAAGRAGGAQMGNLVAQINDIGQMVAAGQNPLMLAVQQGTQLAQVLGPMGAGGALRAFGQAFLAALNPVNLVVIGLTAGVAILGQWAIAALGAGEETADLGEAMDALRRAADAAQRAQRDAAAPVEEQISRYGRLAGAVREAIAAEREMAAGRARREVAEAVGALPIARLGSTATIEALAPVRAELLAANEAEAVARNADEAAGGLARARAALAGLDEGMRAALPRFSLELERVAAELGVTEEAALALARAAAALGEAQGLADQATAARDLLAALEAAFGSLAEADAATGGVAGQVAALVRITADLAAGFGEVGASGADGLGRIGTAADGAGRKLDELVRLRTEILTRGLDPVEAAGIIARVEFDAAHPAPADGDREALDRARVAAIGYARAVAEARQELAALDADDRAAARVAEFERRAAVAQVEAARGRDSAEAAQARLLAERAALDVASRAEGVTDDLRERLLAAWQAAQGLAGVDIASGLALARIEAAGVADEIRRAVGAVRELQAQAAADLDTERLRSKYADDPVGLAGELAFRRAVAAQGVQRDGAEGLDLASLDAEAVALRRAAEEAERLRQARLNARAAGGAGVGAGAGASLPPELAELARLIDTLPVRSAQLGERVRAGLMTGAEGARALADEQRRVAEGLADLIPLLEGLGAAGEAGAERARAALAELAATLGAVLDSPLEALSESLEGSLEGAFVAWVKGAQDAGEMMYEAIVTELAKLAYAQFISPLIQPLLSGLVGLLGGLFGLSAAQGAVVGGAGATAFRLGGLPGLDGFSDRILDRPTLFAMAGGRAGLMAEAGAEAIMPVLGSPAAPAVRAVLPGGGETALPLARAASGHLAVAPPEGWPGPVRRRPNRISANIALIGEWAENAGFPGLDEHTARDALAAAAPPPAAFALGGILPWSDSLQAFAAGGVPDWMPPARDALAAAAPPPAAFALGGILPWSDSLQAFAAGGVPDWMPRPTGSTGRPAGGAPGGMAGEAAGGGRRGVTVEIHNHAAGAAEVSDVRTSERDGKELVEVIIARVDQALAEGVGRGTARLAAALSGTYGLRRTGR